MNNNIKNNLNFNNNFMMNNPMMGNHMKNNLILDMMNQINNNMMNPIMIKNMMKQIFSIMEKNPMMAIQIMNQINPIFLSKCLKILEKENNKKKIKKNKIFIEKLIPEYETIDTETNPLNKYIENAINLSYAMKLEIIKQKNSNPNKFINIFEVLSSPGLLSGAQPNSEDYKYILCLIGKILENNGIIVGIYKENNNKDRVDLSTIQFIFSGLITKKKFKLKFSVNEFQIITIIHDLSFRKKFINDCKSKIANKLGIDKNLIILTNPRKEKENLYLDLAFNPEIEIINEIFIRDNIVGKEIIGCQMIPLLEACRLSPSIFEPKYNKFYNFTKNNLTRGGEEYLQPLSWAAYGINILGKYDFGNDIWLGNNNNIGEFAVAYYGINNLFNQNFNKVQNLICLMGNEESGRTFLDVNNIRNPGQKCKIGAYFYKNPNHSENSSDIINIGGFQYKIMFMCRVNASKIRQPENFPDCWILSPTPDEVRPYKILIKNIPISPLAIASQQEIKFCFGNPSPSYFQIFKNKDESYFNNNNNININNYDFILKYYTGGGFFINNYLRQNYMNLLNNQFNSYIWCLHKAITQNSQNVPNGITVYRGVNVKIPNNIGIGNKFYFPEFLSTSKDIKMAETFAGNGTLMIISVLNNGINGKKIYCRDIETISGFPFEKEIIFTSHCQFKVTKIQKTFNLDKLYLTCEGYNF